MTGSGVDPDVREAVIARSRARGEHSRVATGGRVERGSRPRARAASVVVPLPRRISGERLDLARLVPSGRSLGIALLIVVGAARRLARARETGVFAVRTVDVAGGASRCGGPGAARARADARHEPAQARSRRVAAGGGGPADRRERALRPCLPAHPARRRRARARRSRSSAREPTPISSPRAAA